MTNDQICQSCGLPLDKDPHRNHTKTETKEADKYCSFCFSDGKFVDEGITLREKIEKNIRLAVACVQA